MKIQTLSPITCFSEGSELWVVGSFESSFWTKKLNWLMNQQIVQILNHKSRSMDPLEREHFLRFGVQPQEFLKNSQNVLVESSRYFPNRWVFFCPEDNLNTWVQESLNALQGLKVSHARFFLPGQFSNSDFSTVIGSEKQVEAEVELVLE